MTKTMRFTSSQAYLDKSLTGKEIMIDYPKDKTVELFDSKPDELVLGNHKWVRIDTSKPFPVNHSFNAAFVVKNTHQGVVLVASVRKTAQSMNQYLREVFYKDTDLIYVTTLDRPWSLSRELLAILILEGYRVLVSSRAFYSSVVTELENAFSEELQRPVIWSEVVNMLLNPPQTVSEPEEDTEFVPNLKGMSGFTEVPGGYLFKGRKGKERYLGNYKAGFTLELLGGSSFKPLETTPEGFSGCAVNICYSSDHGCFLEAVYAPNSTSFRLQIDTLRKTLNFRKATLTGISKTRFEDSLDFTLELALLGFPVLIRGLDSIEVVKRCLIEASGLKVDWEDFIENHWDVYEPKTEAELLPKTEPKNSAFSLYGIDGFVSKSRGFVFKGRTGITEVLLNHDPKQDLVVSDRLKLTSVELVPMTFTGSIVTIVNDNRFGTYVCFGFFTDPVEFYEAYDDYSLLYNSTTYISANDQGFKDVWCLGTELAVAGFPIYLGNRTEVELIKKNLVKRLPTKDATGWNEFYASHYLTPVEVIEPVELEINEPAPDRGGLLKELGEQLHKAKEETLVDETELCTQVLTMIKTTLVERSTELSDTFVVKLLDTELVGGINQPLSLSVENNVNSVLRFNPEAVFKLVAKELTDLLPTIDLTIYEKRMVIQIK